MSKLCLIGLAATLVLLSQARSFAGDDVRSCASVIDLLLEADWKESHAKVAEALGVEEEYVDSCVDEYKAGKKAAAVDDDAARPEATCSQIVAALESGNGSAEEVAKELHTTPDRVRSCADQAAP